jgi:NADH:ubiquinone oxidoreductase subunit D
LAHLATSVHPVRSALIADVPAIVGSIDLGEIDR